MQLFAFCRVSTPFPLGRTVSLPTNIPRSHFSFSACCRNGTTASEAQANKTARDEMSRQGQQRTAKTAYRKLRHRGTTGPRGSPCSSRRQILPSQCVRVVLLAAGGPQLIPARCGTGKREQVMSLPGVAAVSQHLTSLLLLQLLGETLLALGILLGGLQKGSWLAW